MVKYWVIDLLAGWYFLAILATPLDDYMGVGKFVAEKGLAGSYPYFLPVQHSDMHCSKLFRVLFLPDGDHSIIEMLQNNFEQCMFEYQAGEITTATMTLKLYLTHYTLNFIF